MCIEIRKKFIISLLCAFIFIILLACSGKNTSRVYENENVKELPIIKIDRPNVKKLPYLKLSELATDIRYIKLETRKDVLLEDGSVLYLDKSKLMLVRANYQLWLFNTDGKFNRKIGRIGRGPNEFILDEIAVDVETEIIYIYPLYQSQILKFDFQGNSLGQIKNYEVGLPAKMVFMDDQLILINGISPYLKKEKGGFMELYSFNPDSNKINYYLPNYWDVEHRKNMPSFEMNGQEQFSVVNNKVGYYKMRYCDTLYKVSNNKIDPFLIFDMGKYKYSIENSQLPPNKWPGELLEYKILLEYMMATNNHLFFSYSYFRSDNMQDIEGFLCVLDLKTNKISYYNSIMINDINGGPNVFPRDLSGSGMLLPVNFKGRNDEIEKNYFLNHEDLVLKFPERKNEFNNIMAETKIDDNPIVQIIELRDDY